MGSSCSSFADLSQNEYLLKFIKEEKIDRDSQYWNEFLSFKFNIPIDKSTNCLLKESIENLCSVLVVKNKLSGNFTTLACLGIFYLQKILNENDAEEFVLEKTENVLLIIRCCCEYMTEHLNEKEIISHFHVLPDTPSNKTTILEEFLYNLSKVISSCPVDEKTYHIHLEAITIQLVLFSIQMYQEKSNNQPIIITTAMNTKCSQDAVDVVQKLCFNYIKNDPPPEPSQSFFGWAAAGLMSIIANPSKSTSHSLDQLFPLSSHSLLLLLVYLFHNTKASNPFRDALISCKPGKKSEDENAQNNRSFPLNFRRLHSSLSRDLQHDQAVLLLYILIHKNPSFLDFLLKHKDLEKLILPILEVLFKADHQNAHHIYMALIVILIFSQHVQFNAVIHDIIIPDVPWYTDRKLNNISLGSLLVLIILRTIHFNMTKMRDKYLHTNCLASLANMACYFKSLHSFATQRFIRLFKHLIKQYKKLSEKIKTSESTHKEELSDLDVMEEIIRMLLEILNACLYHQVKENTNLVYQLLREKEFFQSLLGNSKFEDVLENINMVLVFFSKKVEHDADVDQSSAENVMALVDKAFESWHQDNLKKFPQLKFKYMEEDDSEQFFIPYIWSIIYKYSFLYWNSSRITLFHPNSTTS